MTGQPRGFGFVELAEGEDLQRRCPGRLAELSLGAEPILVRRPDGASPLLPEPICEFFDVFVV
jgi:hypothetical protein